MRSLYNLLFLMSFALSAPFYFFKMWRRGNWQSGFRQRFGLYDNKIKQSITNRHILWFHAVSVGEMNVCTQLIRALEPRMPNVKFMVSTTTTTGMGELQKRLPQQVGKVYYPIDRRKYVARALATLHPDAVVLIEAEIWPNFIWRSRALGIPLFLVNARLSDRSYPRYKKFGFLFRKLFDSFSAVGAQNEGDAAKLRELGCHPEAVNVAGNLKFDAAKLDADKTLDVPGLLAQLGVAGDAQLLVAGSTHAGEEEILAEQFLRLRKRFPNLFLIIVPRHFERARDIGRELEKHGLKLFYRSEITSRTSLTPGAVECLLVDSTGELMSFYQQATVVFVGKSLTAKGGQNPIEPAALGKATIFGPNMQNFADVARIFISHDGAVQVANAEELERALGDLLADPARRAELGCNAQRIVRENQGAVERTVEMILKGLASRDLYIVPKK
ncbi:MAG: Three-deoxy-D-manno-octulosonic-acid transferase domain protein [Pedosphaera sp.]|nr:Three-deoxy-D-manno-octulosonic-acid transferase domain protein [Pedosphaera sp.]